MPGSLITCCEVFLSKSDFEGKETDNLHQFLMSLPQTFSEDLAAILTAEVDECIFFLLTTKRG